MFKKFTRASDVKRTGIHANKVTIKDCRIYINTSDFAKLGFPKKVDFFFSSSLNSIRIIPKKDGEITAKTALLSCKRAFKCFDIPPETNGLFECVVAQHNDTDDSHLTIYLNSRTEKRVKK